ncbi:Uncharacterised protein [Vibrio cholerae]|nr:Uncharacterised protein [Vibrio cholerae]
MLLHTPVEDDVRLNQEFIDARFELARIPLGNINPHFVVNVCLRLRAAIVGGHGLAEYGF